MQRVCEIIGLGWWKRQLRRIRSSTRTYMKWFQQVYSVLRFRFSGCFRVFLNEDSIDFHRIHYSLNLNCNKYKLVHYSYPTHHNPLQWLCHEYITTSDKAVVSAGIKMLGFSCSMEGQVLSFQIPILGFGNKQPMREQTYKSWLVIPKRHNPIPTATLCRKSLWPKHFLVRKELVASCFYLCESRLSHILRYIMLHINDLDMTYFL